MNTIQSFKRFMGVFVLVLSCVFIVPAFAQAICGDPVLDPGEECDDGNMSSGDGCSDSCLVEPGYTCDNSNLPSICDLGCDITVVNSAAPAYNTEFPFLRLTIPLFDPTVFDQFMLADGISPQDSFSVPFLSLTFIAELPPTGWSLDNIQCGPANRVGDGSFDPGDVPNELSGASLDNIVLALCLFTGEATCTYTNSANEDQRCNLTVEEEVVHPTVNTVNTLFPFNVSAGELDESFEISDGEDNTTPDLPLSTDYTITQTIPEDWLLDSISCDGDADFTSTVTDNTVEVTCNSPGEVSCTFVNRAIIIRNVPTLSEWGLVATAVFMGIAGVLFYRRRMLKI